MKDIKAIVYTSNAGHTKQYAELLGSRTGMEVYELNEAKKLLDKGAAVIYMGWLMAGVVKGFSKARKRYDIKAVCAVGMAKAGSQAPQIRNTNGTPQEMPVFCLQGGLEISKLRGIYRLMMNFMGKSYAKNLKAKKKLTPEEAEMKKLFEKGGNLVDGEKLTEVVEWFNN